MHHICLVPGLGVDERLFQNLHLDQKYPQTVLKWISPAKIDESLYDYATRLAKQIPKTNHKLVLIGVSFGGIMAIELAKILNPDLTIIISSVKNRHELPWYYKLAGKFYLARFLPIQWGKYFHGLQAFIFGAKSQQDKLLLRQFIQETDLPYLRWSLSQIPNWQHTTEIPNLIHLHGSHDKIFPIKYLKNIRLIQDGEHLMVLSQAEKIREIIYQEIDKLR